LTWTNPGTPGGSCKPPPGVHDVSPSLSTSPGWQKQKGTPTGFWRVRVWLPANPEPGAPDHVVAARDEIEAEARCFLELGIRSVDKSVNNVEITPVAEIEFVRAQARRLRVDLRSQRRTEFRAAIQDVLDRVPTTHTEKLASLMTLNFQEFDDVSFLAA
jgi:hypothetical protein